MLIFYKVTGCSGWESYNNNKRTCLGTTLCLVLLPLQCRYDKQVISWKRFVTVLATSLFSHSSFLQASVVITYNLCNK